MCIPTGDGPDAVATARHELAHTALSPDRPPASRYAIVFQCVEDPRINLALRDAGIPLEMTEKHVGEVLSYLECDFANPDRKQGTIRAMLRGISCIGWGEALESGAERILSAEDPRLGSIFRGARKRFERAQRESVRRDYRVSQHPDPNVRGIHIASGGEQKNGGATARTARWLIKELENLFPPESTSGNGSGSGSDSASGSDAGTESGTPESASGSGTESDGSIGGASETEASETENRKRRKPTETPIGDALDAIEELEGPRLDLLTHPESEAERMQRIEVESDEALMARMHVRRPKRIIPCSERTWGNRDRFATDVGAVLSYPHRWAMDRKVFRRNRRKELGRTGGSVLIDVSGSMKLGPDDVRRMAAIAPRRTIVAHYCGGWVLRNDDGSSLSSRAVPRDGRSIDGELTILAVNGMRCADKEASTRCGGGNEVDFQALRWLAAQPEPRIWVSDAQVCGGPLDCLNGDLRYLERSCEAVCREHRIIRVDTCGEAEAVISGKVPPSEFEREEIVHASEGMTETSHRIDPFPIRN